MAYELKDLIEKLKDAGLEQTEDAAIKFIEVITSWADSEADKNEKGLIDFAVKALIPIVKPALLKLGDKIDGEVG